MKRAKHCDQCFWFAWYTDMSADPMCVRGHKPRFYPPRHSTDDGWGWKRRCHDYTKWSIDRVLTLDAKADKTPEDYKRYAFELFAETFKIASRPCERPAPEGKKHGYDPTYDWARERDD